VSACGRVTGGAASRATDYNPRALTDPRPDSLHRRERALAVALAVALGAYVCHLAVVASRLPVDYWDGYEYLMNARSLAGHHFARLAWGYLGFRPPLVPALIALFLGGYAPAGGGTALWGPHLVAASLSVLSLIAFYRLLRQEMSPTVSLIGCAVLVANPLFTHYAPFVLVDMPVMLFVTASASAYLRGRRTGRWLDHALAGVALSAAILSKYSAVSFLGSLGLYELLRAIVPGRAEAARAGGLGRRLWRLATDPRPWLVVLVTPPIVYAVHVAVHRRLGVAKPVLQHLREVFLFQMGMEAFASDPKLEYLWDFADAFSLPVLAPAALGALVALARRSETDLLCLAWLGVVSTSLTMLVGHKEARYAFPVLPPLVYLIVRGMGGVLRVARRLGGDWAVVPACVALALLFLRPVGLAASELACFHDPAYAEPYLPRLAAWVRARSAPGQPVLVGNDFVYTIYPKRARLPLRRVLSPPSHRRPGAPLLHGSAMGTIDPLPSLEGDWAPFVERFRRARSCSRRASTSTPSAGWDAEPPVPIVATAIRRRTLRRMDERSADGIVYRAPLGDERVALAPDGDGWRPVTDLLAGWRIYERRPPGGPVVRFEPGAPDAPPAVLELVKIEQVYAFYR
jgi:4-amino-4-deoxy-L-arabinose transferase-like glycosyltransferase